jgi:hypothetical protein
MMDYRWFSLPAVIFAQYLRNTCAKTPQKTSLFRCHTLTIIGVIYKVKRAQAVEKYRVPVQKI